MREELWGGLTARVWGGTDGRGAGKASDPLVVLCHGFGAPGDDLVPLARYLDVPRETRFVFPEAPLVTFGGGRAWWHLDMERMQAAMRGEAPIRDDEVPDGMAAAREKVGACIDEACRALEADPKRIIIGGFSQGAMVTCDLALETDRPLGGLALLSGTLLTRAAWAKGAAQRRELPVFQSHGREDPLLPFAAAERLRDLLTGAGLSVSFTPFRGGHEIPPTVLDGLGAFITSVAARAA